MSGRRIALLLLAATPALAACVTSTRLSARDTRALAGRTYIIAGASSGFGRGTAVRLGAHRANVVLAARRADLLEEVAAEVRANGGTALVVPTDVSDAAAVDRLAAAAVARFGRIDVWMNVAGVGAVGRFWDIPAADHARIIDVNVNGVLHGSRAAIRRFIEQGAGTLVNIGSVESEVPLAYHASYAASKAAVLSIARSVNQELRHAGHGKRIRIATVMPWAADTPWFAHAANHSGRAPRMIMMDDPGKVVDAMVWVSLHPREELPVGWKAQAAYSFHRVVPDLVERVSANIHRAELEKGSPAPATSGSLHQPVPEGRGVEGGVRKRMEAEDRARGAQPD